MTSHEMSQHVQSETGYSLGTAGTLQKVISGLMSARHFVKVVDVE